MAAATIRAVIVEDDESFAELLQSMLTAGGIEVAGWASDGLQALNLVELTRPDVVTMDIDMPRLDGVETTRLLTERHPEIAVIVVTGSRSTDAVDRAKAAGARAAVRKSAVHDELVAAAHAAFGQ